jgi:hypothetical protein
MTQTQHLLGEGLSLKRSSKTLLLLVDLPPYPEAYRTLLDHAPVS